MSGVSVSSDEVFEAHVPLLIVGAGAAGLCAALAAKEAGVEPIVIERDAVPSRWTAPSAGLTPGAGTGFQRVKDIEDNPARPDEDNRRFQRRRAGNPTTFCLDDLDRLHAAEDQPVSSRRSRRMRQSSGMR